MCLYGFASVQNLGHTRLRHPCLACPSRCIDPLHPHNPRKRTIIHRSAPIFPKPHYPSLRTTTLASLVKGELLLLSFVQPTIEGLPHRTLSFPQPLQKDNNPSPHVCPFYNTSITHKSVHRLISQPLEQLHRKTGAKCRNNSTLPCSDYREIKQQQ